MSTTSSGLLSIADVCPGWTLAPEGAAIFEEARTAVIADVHLGYEWSRGSGGDAIPAHSLAETVAKLEALLARVEIRRLVVAGDMVESSTTCRRTNADVLRLIDWLAGRDVELLRIRGNHDAPTKPSLPTSLDLGGWKIAHGDRPVAGDRRMIGHHHPALRVEGWSAPSFLYGPTLIVLPAFSPNAAGLDVTTAALPRPLRLPDLRLAATLGGEILDFGPLAGLADRLQMS